MGMKKRKGTIRGPSKMGGRQEEKGVSSLLHSDLGNPSKTEPIPLDIPPTPLSPQSCDPKPSAYENAGPSQYHNKLSLITWIFLLLLLMKF